MPKVNHSKQLEEQIRGEKVLLKSTSTNINILNRTPAQKKDSTSQDEFF